MHLITPLHIASVSAYRCILIILYQNSLDTMCVMGMSLSVCVCVCVCVCVFCLHCELCMHACLCMYDVMKPHVIPPITPTSNGTIPGM